MMPNDERKMSEMRLMMRCVSPMVEFLVKRSTVSKISKFSEPLTMMSEIFGVKYALFPLLKHSLMMRFLVLLGMSLIKTASYLSISE